VKWNPEVRPPGQLSAAITAIKESHYPARASSDLRSARPVSLMRLLMMSRYRAVRTSSGNLAVLLAIRLVYFSGKRRSLSEL